MYSDRWKPAGIITCTWMYMYSLRKQKYIFFNHEFEMEIFPLVNLYMYIYEHMQKL